MTKIQKTYAIIAAVLGSVMVLWVGLALVATLYSMTFEPDGKGFTSKDILEGRSATCVSWNGMRSACTPGENFKMAFVLMPLTVIVGPIYLVEKIISH